MSSMVAVTNTIAFVFPDTAAQPSISEMARFVKSLNGTQGQIDTAYKNSQERTVLIKYKSEKGMQEALSSNATKQMFNYSNGKQVEVCMSVAGCNIQYVRVFDLPPEMPDSALTAELQKFGTIKRCVREKYPQEYELDCFTGVRGIYMDIDQEIPPALTFLNRRGRIFYRGNRLICFGCGQEGHLKKFCGKKKMEQPAPGIGERNGKNTFAAVLAGMSSSDVLSSSQNRDRVEERREGTEQEESAAAANIDNALSDNNTVETEEDFLDEEVGGEVPSGATEENNGKPKPFRFADDPIYQMAKELHRVQQEREAEEQRQQRKKSGARAKTVGFSPPMKKKY